MANTTNLGLNKLAGTEKLKTFPTPYNDNMDAIDAAFGAGFGLSGNPNVNASINNLGDGLAILANGNTHAAITAGQFVYVRGHGSLSEGLYTATSNIAQNGTLSGSNLTADSSGGLNALNSNLGTIGNNRLETRSIVTQSSSDFKDFVVGVITATGLVDKPLLISIGNQVNNGWMIYHPGTRRFFAVWGTEVYNGIANTTRTGWSQLFQLNGTPVT